MKLQDEEIHILWFKVRGMLAPLELSPPNGAPDTNLFQSLEACPGWHSYSNMDVKHEKMLLNCAGNYILGSKKLCFLQIGV